MSTLIERLHEVMQTESWDHAKLMEVSGQSSSVVSQWLGKGSKVIKTIGKLEAAQGIEAASRFAALWVAKGVGPKFKAEPAKTLVAHGLSHWDATVSLPEVKWEELPMADLSQPFQLVVTDDALGPVIYPGCIARFKPNGTPRPGWPVLVRDRTGTHYLRDYVAGPLGRWQAVARTHGFAPLDSEVDGLTVVAVMTGYDWT